MHKIGIGVMCLMFVVFFGATLEVSGQNAEVEMCLPMGIIPIEPPDGVEAKRTAVEFDHGRHLVRECKECHHTWQGDTKIKSCTTSECHNLIESPGKSKKYLSYTKESIIYYKYAYHQMCISCHKEIKVKNRAIEMSAKVSQAKIQTAGPSGCVECHPK